MTSLARIGFILIFAGIALAFIAALLPALGIALLTTQPSKNLPTPSNRTSIGVGGCIVIFFVPICFGYGTGHLPITMLIIALALAAIIIVFAFLLLRIAIPRPRVVGSP